MEINDNNVKSLADNINNSTSVKQVLQSNKDIKPQEVYFSKNNETPKRVSSTKKAQSLSTILKTFAIVATTTVLGVVSPISILPEATNIKVMELVSYDTGVFYMVSVSDHAQGLTVELYNDFTNRVQKIEEDFGEGQFEDLSPNMKYTFAIKKGLKVLYKKTVTTSREEQRYVEYDYKSSDRG